MHLAKSTYYFEINKVDVVKSKNAELMSEIQEIFDYNKGRYGVRRVQLRPCKNGIFPLVVFQIIPFRA